jgi:cell division protein FtsA
MVFGLRRKKKHYALSLDIGTEFVKVLVFRVEDEKANVVGVGKQRQKLTDMQGGKVTDISAVIANCEKAIDQAVEMAGVAPRQCIIGIAGELVKGTTTTVHFRRDNPEEKITIKEIREIIDEVQKKTFDKARSSLAWETGYSEIDVKLVNSAVVDVKIDGYKVTNPIGFQGRDVAIGIFNAFAPIVHLGALQTIASGLGLDLLAITSEPYAVARSVGLEELSDFSSIFIDVGGGTTDIAVARSGGVEGTRMFAIGGRVFTKSIADVLEVDFEEAEKIKLKYSKGELTKDEELCEKIAQALKNDCEVWLAGVELALEEFTNIDLLPSRIMLCGGGSLLPEIQDYLSQTAWVKRLPFAKQPKVEYINPSQVPTVKDETKKLIDAQDITPMAMANLAIDLAGEEKLLDGILSKVADGLRS